MPGVSIVVKGKLLTGTTTDIVGNTSLMPIKGQPVFSSLEWLPRAAVGNFKLLNVRAEQWTFLTIGRE